jgi:hypothetical protein
MIWSIAKITGLTATRAGGKLEVRWHAADALNCNHPAEAPFFFQELYRGSEILLRLVEPLPDEFPSDFLRRLHREFVRACALDMRCRR